MLTDVTVTVCGEIVIVDDVWVAECVRCTAAVVVWVGVVGVCVVVIVVVVMVAVVVGTNHMIVRIGVVVSG